MMATDSHRRGNGDADHGANAPTTTIDSTVIDSMKRSCPAE